MRLTTLARRYAGALFRAAKDADAIDNVESDLGLISYTLQAAPRLREALAHPLIPPARKKEIVAELFEGAIQDVTLHFLGLLIDKRREEVLEDVEPEYVRLANEFQNIMPVVVTSAVPLTSDEVAGLQAKLAEFTGKKVELELEEDPSLIGGLVVRISDTVIDGSVRGYLASLKDRLLGE